MAKNILQKAKLDSPVIVWNRTTSKAEDLSKEFGNSTVASSPEDAVAKADIVFTSVAGDKDITGLIDKVLQGDVKGKLFVDTSTVHPDTTNQLNKTIEAQGATFVACPGTLFLLTPPSLLLPLLPKDKNTNPTTTVFGAPAMAESGSLVSVLAGPSAAVEKVKPYTKGVIARAFIDFSDQAPGQATLLKLIGNTFVLQMVEALAEGHTLAEKTGLGNENLHQFIEVMFPGPYAAYSTRMMTGDYYSREKVSFFSLLCWLVWLVGKVYMLTWSILARLRRFPSPQRCRARHAPCRGVRHEIESR